MRFIYRIKQLMLGGGDLLCFAVGFWLSLALRYWQIPPWEKINAGLGLFFILFLFWIVIIFINGLYDLHLLKETKKYKRFLEAAGISAIFGIIYFYIVPTNSLSPKTLLLFNVCFGFGLSYLWRLIYNHYLNAGALKTKIIFVGYTPETEELISIIANFPERGYQTVALIDPAQKTRPEDHPFFEIYQDLTDLESSVRTHQAEILIIAPHLKKEDSVLRELYKLFFWDIKIIDLASFYEIITGRIPPFTFSEAWFLEHLKRDLPIYDKIRNAFDLLVGGLMFLLFIILLPFIYLLIKLSSPGPIFFTQKRIGQLGKPFTIYKFRSMFAISADGSAEIDGAQFAVKDDIRITWIGRFLRKSRLDELPQCLNLLKREISLIGPRPERPEIVSHLTELLPYYPLRNMVKPGLTGWAVIHQNYTDNYESSLQKLQYDLFYIKNRSFLLDLAIILRTINVIIRMMGQ